MNVDRVVARLRETSVSDYRGILSGAVREDLIESDMATVDDVEAFEEEIASVVDASMLRLMSPGQDTAAIVEDMAGEVRSFFAGVEERRAELATAVAEAASRLGTHVMDVERMRRRGILVDVDIHGVSLLRKRVSWAELGIPEGDVRRERLHRGTKYIFPHYAKAFRSLEQQFRKCLDAHSFDLAGFRPYRFVPVTAYDSWREAWGELVKDWDRLLQDLLAAYDQRLDEERDAAAEMAVESWDSLMSRHRTKAREAGQDDDGEVAVIIGNKAFVDLDKFVAWLQEHATRYYPSKDTLKDSLYPAYKTSMILAPGDLLADKLRDERLQTKIAEEQAKQRAEMAEVRTKEEQERIKQRKMRAKAQAMYEAEMERAREMVAETVSPFQEAFEKLRAQIHEDVLEIAASVEKHGYVRGRVADRARRLHETFSLLNAHDDDELAQALSKLKGNLQKNPEVKKRTGKTYDPDAVIDNLKSIERITHDAAQEVARRAQEPTSGIALDL